MRTGIKMLTLGLLVAVGTASCEKEDTMMSINRKADMTNGKYEVSMLEVNGTIATEQYNNYVFTFGKEGKLEAASGGRISTGAWSTGISEGQDVMRINFGDQAEMNLLSNDKWKIVSHTWNTLRLHGERGDDGSAELEFKLK